MVGCEFACFDLFLCFWFSLFVDVFDGNAHTHTCVRFYCCCLVNLKGKKACLIFPQVVTLQVFLSGERALT